MTRITLPSEEEMMRISDEGRSAEPSFIANSSNTGSDRAPVPGSQVRGAELHRQQLEHRER